MTTRRLSIWGDPDAGGAGKGLLVFLGIIALLGFGVWMLWKPVFQPMIGEAVPTRMEHETTMPLPAHDPKLIVSIESDWVAQRGVFNDATALIRTPDLALEITVDTWVDEAGPSIQAAMQETLERLDLDEAATLIRTETIQPGVIAQSAIVTDQTDREHLVVAFGAAGDPLGRAAATLTATLADGSRAEATGDLRDYVPAVANLLAEIEVVQ